MCAKGIVVRGGEPGQFAAAPLSAVSLPLRCPRPVASSRWHSATAPHCQEHLRISAPASNKPHPAEKRTPVWLAIWRTWAGFANSQLWRTTFHSTYSYKCTSSLLPTWSRCSDIANLSAHLHRLPTPPPYLRRMRLPHGRDAGVVCWIWL